MCVLQIQMTDFFFDNTIIIMLKNVKFCKKVLTNDEVRVKITPVPRMERAPCKLNNETLTSTR